MFMPKRPFIPDDALDRILASPGSSENLPRIVR